MSNNSERSTYRGRSPGFKVSGRGGAGNFRSSSSSKEDEATAQGPDDYSDSRGRDPIPSTDPYVTTSTGRGGAGNIGSASRDAIRVEKGGPETSPLRSELRGRGYDRHLISTIDDAHDTGVHSFGRGGAGNISDSARPNSESSQSRSRSREPVHATGRGGFGKVSVGGPTEKVIEELDESERAAHQQQHLSGLHSSGRGVAGNFTADKVPHREGARDPHGANAAESFGRGGRGNISREHSGEPGDNEHAPWPWPVMSSAQPLLVEF